MQPRSHKSSRKRFVFPLRDADADDNTKTDHYTLLTTPYTRNDSLPLGERNEPHLILSETANMADALKDVPVKSVQVEALVSFSSAPPRIRRHLTQMMMVRWS